MSVKLLAEHYLEFLILKGGCAGSSESTLLKMPQCWKPHVVDHMLIRRGNKTKSWCQYRDTSLSNDTESTVEKI